MSDRVAAFGIAVSDLKRSADFYTRVLGMKQMQTFNLPHMDEIIVGFDKGTPIVLMCYKDGVKRNIGDFAGKLVFYVDDAKAVAGRIRAEGLPITREPEKIEGMGDTLVGFGTDPDGYDLELLQQG